MVNPIMFCDFLTDSFNIGASCVAAKSLWCTVGCCVLEEPCFRSYQAAMFPCWLWTVYGSSCVIINLITRIFTRNSTRFSRWKPFTRTTVRPSLSGWTCSCRRRFWPVTLPLRLRSGTLFDSNEGVCVACLHHAPPFVSSVERLD
jgi:hypothetical protein